MRANDKKCKALYVNHYKLFYTVFTIINKSLTWQRVYQQTKTEWIKPVKYTVAESI